MRETDDVSCILCGWAMGEREGDPQCGRCKKEVTDIIDAIVCVHCGYYDIIPVEYNELGIIDCPNCGFGFIPEE